MIQRIIRISAWLTLAFIIFATVSPIGLRPHDFLPVDIDRALAFILLASLFVAAYPRQMPWVVLMLVVGVVAIELLQEFSPTRHARLADIGVKMVGAMIGVGMGWLVAHWPSSVGKSEVRVPAE